MTADPTGERSSTPAGTQAKADRETEAIAQRARELVAAAPPPTPEQIERVRELLRPLVIGP